MAIIKCKMCGGDMILAEGKTYGTCEYCGSTMTFPKVSDEQKLNLFNRANHFRIILRLARVQSIVAVGVATKEHDPNHQIGKEGGYISAVFFSSSLVDNDAGKKSEYEVISDGTDGGGCIEIFRTVDDAIKRESYLSMFNVGVVSSGSHKVVGTCVIRTSSKLSSELQAALEDAIVKVLLGKH